MTSHPYKAFMANKNDPHPTIQRNIHLSPVEEHYLKKSLIKNQIISELNSLSPNYNDISGLRRFGPPFVPADPQNFIKNPDISTLDQIYSISEANIDIFRDQFPLIRFIFDNYIVSFPFIKIHLNKLGPTARDQSKFWLKIQVLFELFKSKKISNSNDRGTTSKRKLILYKFQSLFLVLFNSSIYCSQDPQYFEFDKERRGAYKKLGKFIDSAESEKLQDSERKEENAKLQLENDKKSDSYLLDMNLSPDNLLDHLNDIDDDEYVNGYYVNIVGVSVESETKTTFWGSKESKYYCFIIHVKKPGEVGWFIKRRYSEFNKLYNEIKIAYPGNHIPELPSKDKHEVEMNLDDDSSNDTLKKSIGNNLNNYDSDMTDLDKSSVDALFANNIGSPASQSFDTYSDSNANSVISESTGEVSSSNGGLLKGSKIGNAFSKSNFLKSPITSPILSQKKLMGNSLNGKNINKVEKSFLSSFKKPVWSSSSTVGDENNDLGNSSNNHKRGSSIDTGFSELSADSIDTIESVENITDPSDPNKVITNQLSGLVIKDDKIVFPREILRQTLRGFLRHLLYIKVVSRSPELNKFLSNVSNPIELTKQDISDIQHRINIDHLRLVQHYKFQNALVGIVKVLEKDVENLKTQIYNEGFGYIFQRIKQFKTLHELCGYDSNINSGSWLKTANLLGSSLTMNDYDDFISSSNDEGAPLRGLVRIILLEIASTQYELLIGSDSAMGTLKTIKRLHMVFPYRLIAGILRFTNPLMMVKRLIDVFTYQMPTVPGVSNGVSVIGNGIGGMMQGLGFKWKKDTVEDEKDKVNENEVDDHVVASKKGRSLLQLIFSGILGEDLRKLEKELVEVRDLLISYNENDSEYGQGDLIVQRIDTYFTVNDETVLHIKDMSQKLGLDIPITILMPNNGLKGCEDLGFGTISNILQDYSNSKKEEIDNELKLKEKKERGNNDDNDEVEVEETIKSDDIIRENDSPYKLAKRYFYLQLRKYDKESMMELWNEPELMSVIKEVISLFLSPLIELFKKAEVYKYVPIFAKYIGELLELCEVYANDYGQFGRSDVVGALVGLAEKYSEDVYKFIRDMYLNDVKSGEENGEGKLFEGIVSWLNGIVSFLRFVKKERPDLMIDLNNLLNGIELTKNDKMDILKVIGEVVTKAEKKKAVLEKMEANGELQKKTVEEERKNDWMKMARDRKVDNQWDAIHDRVFRVGEQIAGEGDDITGLDGVEGAEDIDTDSDEDDETNEINDNNENNNYNDKEKNNNKRIKKLKDYDWVIEEFLKEYYSRDWSKIDNHLMQKGYGSNTFMERSVCGSRIAEAFKEQVSGVLAAYMATQC